MLGWKTQQFQRNEEYVVDIKELRLEQISLCTNFVSRKNIDIDKQNFKDTIKNIYKVKIKTLVEKLI